MGNRNRIRSVILAGGLLALSVWGIAAPAAGGKGLILNGYGLAWVDGAAREVTTARSPYRYTALSPGFPGKVTVIARTDREGGRVSRWWYLRGSWLFPAVAYDGTGGGLSADGGTLVLHRSPPAPASRSTRLAVLDTAVHLRHPVRPGQDRRRHAVSRIALPGSFAFDAISPHGSTVYLRHYLRSRGAAGRPPALIPALRFEIRALDSAGGELLPDPLRSANAPAEPMRGVAISQATSADGRHAYTLYDGDAAGGESEGHAPFVEALDTVAGTAFRLDLPGLGAADPNLFLLRLSLADRGRRLNLLADSWRQGGPTRLVLSVDATRLRPRESEPTATAPRSARGWLAFARTPRHPGNLLERVGTIGRSVEGRPIRLRQVGDPAVDGHLLVFGCIHGDECGVAGRSEPLVNGCPDPAVNALIVPNLNPDGTAAGSRLNGDGVDLNRNFPSGWQPARGRGDPEYPGPRPFSEPEARLAARLVRSIRPEVTIWFHEHHASRPLVRAWGGSLAAARRFARLAGMPFRAIPWPAGTAPNWQNHRFPGAASFVVELPRDRPGERAMESRLDRAVDLTAREVAKD